MIFNSVCHFPFYCTTKHMKGYASVELTESASCCDSSAVVMFLLLVPVATRKVLYQGQSK